MRYTLTEKAIAILLSIILFMGSASGFVINSEAESTFDETIECDNIENYSDLHEIADNTEQNLSSDNSGGNQENGETPENHENHDNLQSDAPYSNDESNNSNEELNADDEEIFNKNETYNEIFYDLVLYSPTGLDFGFVMGTADSNPEFYSDETLSGAQSNTIPIRAGDIVTLYAIRLGGDGDYIFWNIDGGQWITGGDTNDEDSSFIMNGPITIWVEFMQPHGSLVYNGHIPAISANFDEVDGETVQNGDNIILPREIWVSADIPEGNRFPLWVLTDPINTGDIKHIIGSGYYTGSPVYNVASFDMIPGDFRIVRQELEGRSVTYNVAANPGMTAAFTWEGGIDEPLPSGTNVPVGASVTITASDTAPHASCHTWYTPPKIARLIAASPWHVGLGQYLSCPNS